MTVTINPVFVSDGDWQLYVFLCLFRLNYGGLDMLVPFPAPTLCWWAFTMIERIYIEQL